jgi:carbon storage regulator CsrA
MLVISRKVNERIKIVTESGEEIVINVVQILSHLGKSPKVRLTFDAKKSIRIDRTENLAEQPKMALLSGELV